MASVSQQALLMAGPVSGWQSTFTSVFNADNPGWDGYNLRQVLLAPVLSVSGSKVRVTLQASSAAGGFTIDNAEIGHAALVGDAYDFDGTQVALTFSGGSAGVTVAQGNTTLSDEITYAFDETKGFIIAMHFTGTSSLRSQSASANTSAHYKLAANEVSTTDVTAYVTAGDGLIGINKIEVFV